MTTTLNYTPPATIKEFIKAHRPQPVGEEPKVFQNWIIGPVGSGKTTGIFFKLIYMAQLQARSPIDGIRRSKAVVVRNTFPQLRDTTIPSWLYWFQDGVAGTWRATDKTFVLKFGDIECEVLFRALDTADDVARVLSLEVTFVILDEFVTIAKEVVEAIAARAGRYPPAIHGGATNWGMWGSSNPGNEDSWWYKYLIEDDLASHTRLFIQPAGDSPDAENIDNLPGKAAYYTSLKEGKSDEWVKQFIMCQWGHSLDGQPVFPMFRRLYHVSPSPLRANPYLPLVLGVDPGVQHGAVVIGQEDMHGRLLVYDEVITQNMGASRVIAERLRPLLRAKYPGYRVQVAADPAANTRAQSDERTVVDEYRKHFDVRFDTNNTLPPRLAAVEHYMTNLTTVGPALLIDPSCKVTIRALEGGYRYTVPKSGLEKAEPDKNQYSHPADAVQYLAKHCRNQTDRNLKRTNSGFKPPRFPNLYALR
jgi:hypothetical protein